MPYMYEDIKPIPMFANEDEELAYATQQAKVYFKSVNTSEYAIWTDGTRDKYLFIADVTGGIYSIYRLGYRIR